MIEQRESKVVGYSQQAAHPPGRLAVASTFKLKLVKIRPPQPNIKGSENVMFSEPFFVA